MTVGGGCQGDILKFLRCNGDRLEFRLQPAPADKLKLGLSNTAPKTRSTLMPFRQRKSMGHSRRKHGEQGASDFSKRCRGSPGKPGPVSSGDVLPNGTTTGVPSAAATCIGPESLVNSTRHNFSSAISSRSDVLPARFRSSEFGVRSSELMRPASS